MNNIVELNVPSRLEYIGVARLTSSSIANTFDLNVDQIEDIKVCVNEACVNVLNFSDSEQIKMEFSSNEDSMIIKIDSVVENIPEGTKHTKQGEMGLLIISSLMDEVSFEDNAITMVKYI